MPGVLWLASYPKSGNTWVRAFIANYLVNADSPVPINDLPEFVKGDGPKHFYEEVLGFPITKPLSPRETQELRLRVHKKFAHESQNTTIVKTHNAIAYLDDIPTINPEATEGAVYIMRNPLDVVLSYAHHYGMTHDEAIERLGSEENALGGTERQVLQFLGSWSQHVRSWIEAPGLKVHVMRYEDMLLEPSDSFSGLVKFLELPEESERREKAIEFSSFKTLAGQERSQGFIEAVPAREHAAFRGKSVETVPQTARFRGENRVRFFRSGKLGAWRDQLTEEQVSRVVDDHREVMEAHGYLDERGAPVF